MNKLEDLEVYNLAQVFSDKVWALVIQWDPFSKHGLGRQFTDAADSISANIAEGYGRYFIKDNIRFCYYSRGSLLESKNWLLKASRHQLLTLEVHDDLLSNLESIHKKLNGYIKVLRANLQATASKPINK